MSQSQAQRRFVSWLSDVLVYIVVLNLFVEYVNGIVIDSFTISIFTAVLLKALLDLIIGLEHRVTVFFGRWPGRAAHLTGVFLKLAILFLSKFFILEVVNFVFGDHVELHGFVHIAALIITMMAASALVDFVYLRLGKHPASD